MKPAFRFPPALVACIFLFSGLAAASDSVDASARDGAAAPTVGDKQEAAPIPEVHPRPEFDGEATEVHIQLYLIDIVSLNDVSEQVKVDYYFIQRWQDPSLAGRAPTERSLRIEEIWTPSILPMNYQDSKTLDSLLSVDAEGNVILRQRSITTFNAQLYLGSVA